MTSLMNQEFNMKKLALAAALAASALVSAPAFAAATDGALSSADSVGSMTVTTTIPKLVKISGLSDISFSPTASQLSDSSGTQNASERFCVYSNDTVNGLYKLRVDGLAGSELNSGELKFGLAGPNSSVLDLGVWVSDQAAAPYARGTATPGQERANFATTSGGQARPTSLTCNGSTNASLAFKLKNSGILAAVAGTYTGTLTITVSAI